MALTNSEYSGGSTLISFHAEPKPINLWLMQYHGWCKNDDPEILAFLKEALRAAYGKKIFRGGRGEFRYPNLGDPSLRSPTTGNAFLYLNQGDHSEYFGQQLEPFEKFSGREGITVSNERLNLKEEVFWHRCQGMLLIPTESKD